MNGSYVVTREQCPVPTYEECRQALAELNHRSQIDRYERTGPEGRSEEDEGPEAA